MRLKGKRLPRYFVLVVALLGFQFLIRAHNITAQNPYLDEGIHTQRAAIIWQFQVNPGQISDGRLLLYYWLGIFQGSHETAIFTGRESMALWSLLIGAVLYQLGRKLFDPRVGLLSLAFYCVLPMAVFHDRMAMADTFASGFSCLVAWLSLMFIRRPLWRQTLALGLVLTLASFAKMLLAMLPMLVVPGTFIFFRTLEYETARHYLTRWRERYLRPLLAAGLIVLVCWLPILIPAYLAQRAGHPFELLDPVIFAQASGVSKGLNTWDYLSGMFGVIADYTSPGLLIAGFVATVFLVWLNLNDDKRFLSVGYLLFWMLSLTILWLPIAVQTAARYAVPAIAPGIILLSSAIVLAWDETRRAGLGRIQARLSLAVESKRLLVRGSLVALTSVWLITFVTPFDFAAVFSPTSLPLGDYNYNLFLGHVSTADAAAARASQYLDAHAGAAQPIYGDWVVCRLLWFTLDHPIQCLDEQTKAFVTRQIEANFKVDSPLSQSGYIVVSGDFFRPDFNHFDTICPRLETSYPRPKSYDLEIWKFTAGRCRYLVF